MFFSVYRGRWPRQGRATSSRWVQTGSWWGWRHSPIWRAYWNGLQYSIAASWRCSQPWSSPTDPGETTTSWRQRSLVSRQTHNTRLLRACGGHTGPVPISRTNVAPREEKEPGTHRNTAHFCPHEAATARTDSNSVPTKIPSGTPRSLQKRESSPTLAGRKDWVIQWPHSENSIFFSIEWPTERLHVRTKCLLICSKEHWNPCKSGQWPLLTSSLRGTTNASRLIWKPEASCYARTPQVSFIKVVLNLSSFIHVACHRAITLLGS